MVRLESQAEAVIAKDGETGDVRYDCQNDRIRDGDTKRDRISASALRTLSRRRKARRLQVRNELCPEITARKS